MENRKENPCHTADGREHLGPFPSSVGLLPRAPCGYPEGIMYTRMSLFPQPPKNIWSLSIPMSDPVKNKDSCLVRLH